MIKIEYEVIKKAIEEHPKPTRTIAALAQSSIDTINKLTKRETNLSLSALDRLANFLGYNVCVTFEPITENEAAASN